MPSRQTSIRDWMSNPVELNNKCFVKVVREIKVERLEQQEQLHTPEGSQDEVHLAGATGGVNQHDQVEIQAPSKELQTDGVRETTVSEVGRFNHPTQ